MIRVAFLLILSPIVWSCSLKHKIQELYKEQLAAQQSLDSWQTFQYGNLIWDHNSEEYQNWKNHYQILDLQGGVILLPDGHIQAQNAKIHSWSNENNLQQNRSSHLSNSIGATHKKENATSSISHFIKTKFKDKYKRYSPWWLMGLFLILIGLIILKVRKK